MLAKESMYLSLSVVLLLYQHVMSARALPWNVFSSELRAKVR